MIHELPPLNIEELPPINNFKDLYERQLLIRVELGRLVPRAHVFVGFIEIDGSEQITAAVVGDTAPHNPDVLADHLGDMGAIAHVISRRHLQLAEF
jgi:hypothetical protein